MLAVLHIASGDLWGGAETMLWYLAREQRRSGSVSPKVVLLNEGLLADRLREIDVPVTIVPEHSYGSLRLLGIVAKAVRDTAPDLVHTHGRKANVLGAVAARTSRIPSLRTVHGSEEHPPKWWDARRVVAHQTDLLIASRLQSRTVAVSADLARALDRANVRHVQIVHNGIDASLVRAKAPRAEGVRRTAGRVAIGFVGRLTPIKRVDRFLELAAALERRVPDAFRFVVIGDGPQKADAVRMMEALQLTGSVTFMGQVDDVLPALAELDAVAMTSDNEGIPYVVLECLALGVPVLAFSVGGLPEVLADGEVGLLTAAGDLGGLVDHALGVAARPSSVERRIQAGARLVQERFSSQHMMRGYLDIYRDVCGSIPAEHADVTVPGDNKH